MLDLMPWPPPPPPLPPPPKASEAALNAVIAELVGQGMRLEYRDQTRAVLKAGDGVNHVLHGILSVLTFGLWLFVWLMLVLFNKGPRHCTVWIDERGEVQSDQPIFFPRRRTP